MAAEFLLAKASYKTMTGREQKQGEDVLCYQIRQSFYPGEITPEEANRVSYELAMRWTKGRHAFIVTTHTDKEHIHSHIYYNSTTLDCTRKFRNFWGKSEAPKQGQVSELRGMAGRTEKAVDLSGQAAGRH